MALSGIQLSAGIVVGSNTSVDAKYGPYADVATAKSEIGLSLRYKGLTVGILNAGAVEEYWWESGTADGDLVAKGGGGGAAWGSITGTLSDQTDLQIALDGKVDENAPITGATKTKITYDAKGLVTAGEDLAAGDLPTGIDATKIANGTVTNAEFQYLGSVTSDIQTQINSKQETLVSGTNIKTINSASILGSGNISVAPATGIDATAIGSGTVSNTEFGYLDGVTSAIQTQIDSKQATITGAATTIDTEDLTASRALASDGNGKVSVSSVTSTELGYLSGVTSSVQTQINSKISTYDGATYDVTALAAVTQAEYDAIVTKSDTTLYFII